MVATGWNAGWWRWPLLFGAWTLLGCAFAVQFLISSSQAGVTLDWRTVFGGALGDWYVVGILSWPVMWMSRRFELGHGGWRVSLPAHLVGALVFSMAFVGLRAGVAMWQGWAGGRLLEWGALLRPLLIKTWFYNLWIYGVLVTVAQVIRLNREGRVREVRALELEKRLAESRLMALQMQLNPHFLFNALNSVAGLIHRQPRDADRMLVRLADLLRMTLDSTGEQEVTLERELALLERYLDIERIRFGDRLECRFAVEPGLHRALVPTLILQPLVENSIRHGFASMSKRGELTMKARREAGWLMLEVTDNGKGLAAGVVVKDGVGLGNTRARLAQLHGGRHAFEIGAGDAGGVRVAMKLPLRFREGTGA